MSDILDGLLARILKQESDLGAKLDSIADMAFVFSVLIAIVPAVAIPMWLWICVVIIASIRMAAYLIGYKKYHVFSACHTYANKATGGIIILRTGFRLLVRNNTCGNYTLSFRRTVLLRGATHRGAVKRIEP
ncbi:MAG: CDP-alcohol phosphatidyltransferase family protein [Bifidobacterium tibiigranuli]|jgi:phosphatidylglycerophosphate synthase|nr:CDP-alcohol phosphatidyltransferase family protein [Bifidobacterium tibiigranuli]MCI1221992.1 CDP-alcohol phosphatidyltransferase family protein [Bifidobacterium tibiigranuli]MCI1233083.1 CDP-alcohol phosphatidyltransferase family protein [Bifidobacterium tibiigranuli]MCI1254199.1 CDP-alcohol phosphatidyltransferase family protein [Bifidobacterium tibiigranuli]